MADSSFKILGVLLDWFSGGYQNELIDGIEDEAKKRGISVIYFTGKKFDTPERYEIYHNRIYEFIDEEFIDGLLIPVPVVDFYKPGDYHKLLSRFGSIPIVTLSFKCPPFPSVNIDNRNGFKLLVEHMVRKHGFRKFAFIHGPEGHPDAVTRYEVFKEVLAANNIVFDENKRVCGFFDPMEGARAAKILLDDRQFKIKDDIEVFICSSDLMALGVLGELEVRGISVPRDVAVTGFDDIEEGKNRLIPLTTVRHPIRQLGQEGVKAFALGKKEEKLLSTLFVPRGTCGCYHFVRHYYLKPMQYEKNSSYNFLLQGICKIVFSSEPGGCDKAFPEKLINFFLQPLSEEALSYAKTEINSYFIKWSEKWGELESWQDAMIFLEKYILPGENPEEKKKLLQFTKVLVSDHYKHIEMKKRAKLERWEEQLRRVNAGLNASQNLDDISIYFSKAINDELEIKSFYLFLYNDSPDYNHDFKMLRNASLPEKTTDQNHKIFTDFTAIAKTFLIRGKPSSFIVLPLTFMEESIGFTVLEYNVEARLAYESLRIHLSTALNHSFTIIESENRSRQLKKLQGKLVQSAHQAGMAQIAINLMHTISSISNGVFVTIDQLQHGLRRKLYIRLRKANALLRNNINKPDFFFEENARGKLLPDYYEKLAELVGEKNAEIENNFQELEQKILRILMVVDSEEELSKGFFISGSINLVECLESCLSLQNDSIQKSKVQLIKQYDINGKYFIVCFQNKLIYILTKLLDAAIRRTTETRERIITIYIGFEGENILLKIINTGEGIKKEDLTVIFNQNFENKYRTENIDFHFIANSLKEIGALIRAESEGVDHGAAMVISFPAAGVNDG